MTSHHNSFLIALGSNAKADPLANSALIDEATERFKAKSRKRVLTSRKYRTPAFPVGSGPDFVNACARVTSTLEPSAMLVELHAVEAEMGRQRTKRWGQRVIDLDLLASGDTIMPDPESARAWIDLPLSEQMQRAPDRLILPHPRLQDRPFVLVPLADIAPDWVHPLLGLSVRQMLKGMDPVEITKIVPI